MPRVSSHHDDKAASEPTSQKHSGAYFTPDPVVATLLKWAVRSDDDRLLDPSCGDGRFIAGHRNTVGIEQDPRPARMAIARAPWALVHEGDFFSWASETTERFECAAGNPPFIRYQTFKGAMRNAAAALCERLGARFSGLASSWAPFLVATASLLKPGGRMAFVVPAEIGHAPYAAPLLDFLIANFAVVRSATFILRRRIRNIRPLPGSVDLSLNDRNGGAKLPSRPLCLDVNWRGQFNA